MNPAVFQIKRVGNSFKVTFYDKNFVQVRVISISKYFMLCKFDDGEMSPV